MKVIDLYLQASKPYRLDTSNMKEEIFMKELAELRKVLKKGG